MPYEWRYTQDLDDVKHNPLHYCLECEEHYRLEDGACILDDCPEFTEHNWEANECYPKTYRECEHDVKKWFHPNKECDSECASYGMIETDEDEAYSCECPEGMRWNED